jgi:hypothetical protein
VLRFFRKNDPFLLLFIAAFLVIIRTVMLIVGVESPSVLFNSEALGETFNVTPTAPLYSENGAGPLFVFFYGILTLLFDNTYIISSILAAILVFFQALIFNTTLQKNAAFQENNFLAGFLFVVFASASPGFLFLSPILLANTFLLLALDKVLTHLKYRGSEENILTTGFLIGLASLSFAPYFWLVPLVIIIYIMYSSTLVRRYFLMTYGFIFSLLLFWFYYLTAQQGGEFLVGYFELAFSTHLLEPEVLNHLALIFGLPMLFSILSAAQGFQGLGFTNHQILTQRTMLWALIFGLVMIWMTPSTDQVNGLPLIIPLTFFTSQFLITRSKKWVGEVLFLVLIIASLAIQYIQI